MLPLWRKGDAGLSRKLVLKKEDRCYYKFFSPNNLVDLGKMVRACEVLDGSLHRVKRVNHKKVGVIVLIPKENKERFEIRLKIDLERPDWSEILS